MARRFQFRLRAMFYAMTIAAVLSFVLPPIFRAVQQHLATNRPLPVPLFIQVTVHTASPHERMTTIELGSDDGLPQDAVFFQTTIIRVNGKRVDEAGGMAAVLPDRATDEEKLP